RAVDVGEDIEHPLVIADAGRPDTAPVDIPAFAREGGAKIEPVDRIAGQVPVHQIPGMHDLDGRVHVHGGTGEVIVSTDANDVWVLEFLMEEGVRIGAVS